MPTLQIGKKQIPYELRRSTTALERRITITPGRIEVLALANDNDDDIAGFLDRKRKWVFDTVRDMERIMASRHAVPRFVTGSKIPYRGRKMSLTVRRTDAEQASVTYRNGFIVDLPAWVDPQTDTDRLVATELKLWLKQRAREDVRAIAKQIASKAGISTRGVRVADLKNGWGACGPEGNVVINWHLIFAPVKVMEYVVAHELAHLVERSHGADFWALLAKILPDFEQSKRWLERYDGALGSEFLAV